MSNTVANTSEKTIILKIAGKTVEIKEDNTKIIIDISFDQLSQSKRGRKRSNQLIEDHDQEPKLKKQKTGDQESHRITFAEPVRFPQIPKFTFQNPVTKQPIKTHTKLETTNPFHKDFKPISGLTPNIFLDISEDKTDPEKKVE